MVPDPKRVRPVAVLSGYGVASSVAEPVLYAFCTTWLAPLVRVMSHLSVLLGAQPGRHCLRPAAEAVLAQQTVEMGPHRPMRKTEARGDLLVREAGGDEREDLRLARRHAQLAQRRFQTAIAGGRARRERGEHLLVGGGEGVGPERG